MKPLLYKYSDREENARVVVSTHGEVSDNLKFLDKNSMNLCGLSEIAELVSENPDGFRGNVSGHYSAQIVKEHIVIPITAVYSPKGVGRFNSGFLVHHQGIMREIADESFEYEDGCAQRYISDKLFKEVVKLAKDCRNVEPAHKGAVPYQFRKTPLPIRAICNKDECQNGLSRFLLKDDPYYFESLAKKQKHENLNLDLWYGQGTKTHLNVPRASLLTFDLNTFTVHPLRDRYGYVVASLPVRSILFDTLYELLGEELSDNIQRVKDGEIGNRSLRFSQWALEELNKAKVRDSNAREAMK